MSDLSGIGLQLAELSLAQGKGQVEMAAALGISTKHMNLLWNGKVRGSDAVLARWADLLGYELIIGLRVQQWPTVSS